MTRRPRPRWVAVSGGFDPIHVGHIRMIKRARKFGDKVVVILNNDLWLLAKKGFAFMPEEERAEILLACGADKVFITSHQKDDRDRSVCVALRELRPAVFCNGGDRKSEADIPEAAVCKELGIKMVFNVGRGGKVQSSSWLVGRAQSVSPTTPRPWGAFTLIHMGECGKSWVKLIQVNPRSKLSLQSHRSRHEHWVCVSGELLAEVDGGATTLTPGSAISIKAGVRHRLSSEKGGFIVEVATGVADEDDITRIQDEYGRR